MSDSSARILVDLQTGRFEVEGREEFVELQLQRFEPLIMGALGSLQATVAAKSTVGQAPANT